MRAVAALVGVFALLIQALVPAAAMAADTDPRTGLIICVASGAQAFPSPGPPASGRKGFGGMPCQDCLAAALAATITPDLTIQRAAYVTARVEHVAAAISLAPRARAPPRPPGQGPPTV
jgi:hypothetical protein